jgi:hypothetical protein
MQWAHSLGYFCLSLGPRESFPSKGTSKYVVIGLRLPLVKWSDPWCGTFELGQREDDDGRGENSTCD